MRICCVAQRRESEVEESTHSAGRQSAMETALLRMCVTALFKIPNFLLRQRSD